MLAFPVVGATLVGSVASCSVAEDCFTDLVENYREFMVSVSETMLAFRSLIIFVSLLISLS